MRRILARLRAMALEALPGLDDAIKLVSRMTIAGGLIAGSWLAAAAWFAWPLKVAGYMMAFRALNNLLDGPERVFQRHVVAFVRHRFLRLPTGGADA